MVKSLYWMNLATVGVFDFELQQHNEHQSNFLILFSESRSVNNYNKEKIENVNREVTSCWR